MKLRRHRRKGQAIVEYIIIIVIAFIICITFLIVYIFVIRISIIFAFIRGGVG